MSIDAMLRNWAEWAIKNGIPKDVQSQLGKIIKSPIRCDNWGADHFSDFDVEMMRLEKVIYALNKKHMQVIFLAYKDGLSNTSIACILGIARNTVSNRLSAAIDDIEKRLFE